MRRKYPDASQLFAISRKRSWKDAPRRARVLTLIAFIFVAAAFAGVAAMFLLPLPPTGEVSNKDPAVFVWEVRVPPIEDFGPGGSFNVGAPFAEWDLVDRFATERECKHEVLSLRMSGGGSMGSPPGTRRNSAAKCARSVR